MRTKVLLVDDSPPVRLSLEHMLLRHGIIKECLRSAGTATEAWTMFEELQPDVVFMDIDLGERAPPQPGMALAAGVFSGRDDPGAPAVGGEALAKRMLAKNPRVKIVLCTGLGPDDPRVRKMIVWGAFDVITKPLRSTRVAEVLQLAEQEEFQLDRTR
ncbi:MAG: hypothetical protein L3K14_05675 [Thermoplasmata archaeon]|nr:hypothetical protein [Thermoplasmata archaeon]